MVRDTGFMVVYTASVCAVELLIAASERLGVLRLGFLCTAAVGEHSPSDKHLFPVPSSAARRTPASAPFAPNAHGSTP